MFELINNIAVDRKNSLPVADLHARYRLTGTPVVFGDLTKNWRAIDRWSEEYLAKKFGDVEVPIYSNLPSVNGGEPHKPVLHSSLDVYLDELLHKENDLRVSDLPLRSVPDLERDFFYPRLGFDFNVNRTTISIAGPGVMTPMVQSSSILHRVECNFGERVSVLLVPPALSGFMYRVGNSLNSVRDINFDKPQFDKYPALKNIFGYVAELNHGDALYIPPGFWVCSAYHGVAIKLSLEAMRGSFTQYVGESRKFLFDRLTVAMPFNNARLAHLENRAVVETNARLLKRQEQ